MKEPEALSIISVPISDELTRTGVLIGAHTHIFWSPGLEEDRPLRAALLMSIRQYIDQLLEDMKAEARESD